ncbi:nicotinate phosphoribosyltransferase [Thermogutta sp.]|jgi:nicotinate phosphoribosyltransferase|uniref:nicotinate phosphoribosyltransferase n=1 Tax=Thermogutta sp. TaxID=1962930 RepID=UPI00321FE301
MTSYAKAICANPALLTDLYQLTMAQGYWRQGWADRHAVFHLFFRRAPFGGRFAVACGMEAVIDFLKRWRFTEEDLGYLATLKASDGRTLFCQEFLDYLARLRFEGEVLAVEEGTLIFAHEPFLRVQAGLLVAQLLETPLLNLIGFPTLVATKAARVTLAAHPDPVIEFGLRRAQGFEAALIAARATYIGGCVGTSNVLAGKLWDIPVRGTQAHSWILAFGDERRAFQAYAESYPSSCVLLVDTFDTIQGVKHAIEVAQKLKQKGHRLVGIRLDSGELVALSQKARQMLDEAGLNDVLIFASGDLDEYRITRLKTAGAQINAWGVGTRLTTAFDEPALSVVYKLAAIQDGDGNWHDRMKISAESAKQTLPGILRVRRYYVADQPQMDVIYDERDSQALQLPPQGPEKYSAEDTKELLQPLWMGSEPVHRDRNLEEIREYVQRQLGAFPAECLSLRGAKPFPVKIARGVARRRRQLRFHHEEFSP